MKASDILREAAKEVDKNWCRYNFTQSGRVCAVGALRKATLGSAKLVPKGNRDYEEAVEALEASMREHLPLAEHRHAGESYIAHVNDEVAKNRKDISRCMEKAAIKLEEQCQ